MIRKLLERVGTARPLEQRIYDGEQARMVLENEAFAQAFDDIRTEYLQAWMESPARDAEGRERLFLMVKLADKLQGTLTAAMEDGKIATARLKHEDGKVS